MRRLLLQFVHIRHLKEPAAADKAAVGHRQHLGRGVLSGAPSSHPPHPQLHFPEEQLEAQGPIAGPTPDPKPPLSFKAGHYKAGHRLREQGWRTGAYCAGGYEEMGRKLRGVSRCFQSSCCQPFSFQDLPEGTLRLRLQPAGGRLHTVLYCTLKLKCAGGRALQGPLESAPRVPAVQTEAKASARSALGRKGQSLHRQSRESTAEPWMTSPNCSLSH